MWGGRRFRRGGRLLWPLFASMGGGPRRMSRSAGVAKNAICVLCYAVVIAEFVLYAFQVTCGEEGATQVYARAADMPGKTDLPLRVWAGGGGGGGLGNNQHILNTPIIGRR